MVADKHPVRIHMEEGEGIYYMDAQVQFWNEVSKKKLDRHGVMAAEMEEIRQFHSHKIYKKVPLSECCNATGKNPIKVRWEDTSKGDEVNPEYRIRLVAEEIKYDPREDLFATTLPLEAKKSMFSMIVTGGIGDGAGYEKR